MRNWIQIDSFSLPVFFRCASTDYRFGLFTAEPLPEAPRTGAPSRELEAESNVAVAPTVASVAPVATNGG